MIDDPSLPFQVWIVADLLVAIALALLVVLLESNDD